MVLEIPPAGEGSITGSVDDAWQAALEDVGPAGVDKGKGRKYLICRPVTWIHCLTGISRCSRRRPSFAAMRSNLKSGSAADVAKAVAYGKHVSSTRSRRLPARRRDGFCRRGRRRLRQHDSLRHALLTGARPLGTARILDRAGRGDDRLAEIDRHREGQAVRPQTPRRRCSPTGSREARAWFDPAMKGSSRRRSTRAQNGFFRRRRYGRRHEDQLRGARRISRGGRGVAYTMVFFSAKHLGTGQYYLMAILDRDGKPLMAGVLTG